MHAHSSACLLTAATNVDSASKDLITYCTAMSCMACRTCNSTFSHLVLTPCTITKHLSADLRLNSACWRIKLLCGLCLCVPMLLCFAVQVLQCSLVTSACPYALGFGFITKCHQLYKLGLMGSTLVLVFCRSSATWPQEPRTCSCLTCWLQSR